MMSQGFRKRPRVGIEEGIANNKKKNDVKKSLIELLVFNVSHPDVMLGAKPYPDGGDNETRNNFDQDETIPIEALCNKQIFVRPRFNCFNPLCEKIRKAVVKLEKKRIQKIDGAILPDERKSNGLSDLGLPLPPPIDNAKNGSTSSSPLKSVPSKKSTHSSSPNSSGNGEESRGHKGTRIPVGFYLSEDTVDKISWRHVSLKRRDEDPGRKEGETRLVSVLFPLLAQVLHAWNELANSNDLDSEMVYGGIAERTIILISGAGMPRDKFIDKLSNSTKSAAELMKLFINQFYPDVNVLCLDSGLGVFHYDKNVVFCNDIVLPAVENIRRPLVMKYGKGWKKRLNLTIALTDGSAARLAALGASLRIYKPNYLHMWQIKSFWFEYHFLSNDLRFQTFDTMETRPPVPYADLDPHSKQLLDEMRCHKRQFEQGLVSGDDELGEFWLRKTRKCVLAVLMVKGKDGGPRRFFRGMNLEVAITTGSLCAERNVIGTALASDSTLRRQDFEAIAVLAMSLNKPGSNLPTPRGEAKRPRALSSAYSILSKVDERNPIKPCGACNEWLKKIAFVNPAFKVMLFPDSDLEEAILYEVE